MQEQELSATRRRQSPEKKRSAEYRKILCFYDKSHLKSPRKECFVLHGEEDLGRKYMSLEVWKPIATLRLKLSVGSHVTSRAVQQLDLSLLRHVWQHR